MGQMGEMTATGGAPRQGQNRGQTARNETAKAGAGSG
jgi:hypothetical protein